MTIANDEDQRLARLLFTALVAEEAPDPRGGRWGLLGLAEADHGKTILDGGYDLARVAKAFLAAVRAQERGE